ncbi:hypothetical protein GCM10009853_072490 [Glycomyces scopariae]
MAPVQKKPHPVLVVVLLAVVAAVLLAFPVALYANTTALVDGYRASHGQAGVPGTAVVESVSNARGGQVCTGLFTPDDGGTPVEARIEVVGGCEPGQEVQARLMEGRPSPFIGYDDPRAWEPGAGDWATFIPLVVLFGLLSLPLLILLTMIARRLLLGRSRPN